MAGTLPTFGLIRQRYQFMRGETDYTTVNATNDSNINQAMLDVANEFDFTYLRAVTTGTLSAGVFNLAADYNPVWHLPDVRIVGTTGAGSDIIFKEIPVQDRNYYDTSYYVYWITYTPASSLYTFNSNQQTGTVTYTYQLIPPLMVNASDTCPIPDAEAIAAYALSKNWIGDERNQQLAQYFATMGQSKLAQLYQKEVAFGERYSEGSMSDRQPQLNGMGNDPGLNIAHP